MSKTVNVDIDNETGDVSIDVVGGTDSTCHDLTKAFGKLGKTTKDVKYPAFYKQPNQNKITSGKK